MLLSEEQISSLDKKPNVTVITILLVKQRTIRHDKLSRWWEQPTQRKSFIGKISSTNLEFIHHLYRINTTSRNLYYILIVLLVSEDEHRSSYVKLPIEIQKKKKVIEEKNYQRKQRLLLIVFIPIMSNGSIPVINDRLTFSSIINYS